MKKDNKLVVASLFIFSFGMTNTSAQNNSEQSKETVKLKYFNDKNVVQYLILENSIKTGSETKPLVSKNFSIYLDSLASGNLIGDVTTDNNGRAKSFLPPSLKSAWNTSTLHTFIAVPHGNEESTTQLEITKAKLQVDTSSEDSTRSIIVQVSKYENDAWLPANEVEVKVGIRRFGGLLSAGDEESYTTDSAGAITVELMKKNIPGDAQGNIVLQARTEDHDLFGNLSVEKVVPWGIAVNPDTAFFDKRTLWSIQSRTPYWLLMMAYCIIIAIWATIIYLVVQIFKIKKLGSGEFDSSEQAAI